MPKLKILVEGYAKKTKTGWIATSTTVLIQDSGKNIIVDPGINRKLLKKALKAENLTTKDIDIVFMTHHHPDHIFLVGLFENAIALDGETVFTNDLEEDYDTKIPGTNIEILPTPGHTLEHTALIVKENNTVTVVAQDVFWWTDQEDQVTDNYEKLINKEDSLAIDMEALKQSRKRVLEIADFVIPGHGKMFKNTHKRA